MAKYLFQITCGPDVLDVDGREFPNPAAARIAGIKLAGEILNGVPTLLYETAFLKIDVTDERGKVLFKVLVTTLSDDEHIPITG